MQRFAYLGALCVLMVCLIWMYGVSPYTAPTVTRVQAAGVDIAQLQSHRYRPSIRLRPSATAPREFLNGSVSAVISFGDDTASRDAINLRTAQYISSGKSHHLAIRDDEALIGWGSNTYGQITIPTIYAASNPNRETIIDLTSGDNHNVAFSTVIDPDTGESITHVQAWGDNSLGQRNFPARLTNVNTTINLLAAGANHTLAYIHESDINTGELTGTVVCWGNACANSVPAELRNMDLNLTQVDALYAHGNNNAAMLNDGSIMTWSITGTPAPKTYTPELDGAAFQSIALGDAFILIIDTNGVMIGDGINTKGQLNIPTSVACWNTVSAGANHVVALDCDGNAYAWGDNSKKQTQIPRDMPQNLTSIAQIESHGDHTLVLYTIEPTYQLVRWGQNSSDLPHIRTDLEDITAGVNHNLAILSDSTVLAWGDNTFGQSSAPTTLSDTVAIANGTNHSLAVDSVGVVWGWGSNTAGQLNTPTDIGSVNLIAAGRDFSIARAVTETGELDEFGNPVLTDTITIWGNPNKTLPSDVTGQIHELKCFDNHCAASIIDTIEVDSMMFERTRFIDWYYTSDSTGAKTVVTRVPANTDTSYNPDLFAVGSTHMLILQTYSSVNDTVEPPIITSNVKVRGFMIAGTNAGQATDQTIYTQDTIEQVDVTQLSAGETHSVALLADNSIKCWPTTVAGCNIPSYIINHAMISAGKNYTLALSFVDTSRDPTETATATMSMTPTNSRTPTSTRTATATPTNSATRSNTSTRTQTSTITNSRTATATRTSTNTATHTNTRTDTPTASDTPTQTNSRTSTNTPTETATRTSTNTPTATNSRTSTHTRTNTSTQTDTPTASNTRTSTNTPTASNSRTSTRTRTNTNTQTATPTASNTRTPTATMTASNTRTATSTRTPSATATRTNTPTATQTETKTRTPSITSTPTNTPIPLVFRSVSTDSYHTCGLTNAGVAYCWGDNSSYQLGIGNSPSRSVPVEVRMPTGVTFASVSTGTSHTCGLTSASVAYCWGDNEFGQLGNKTTSDSMVPSTVSMPIGVTFASVDAASVGTCALTSTGVVYCWGKYTYWQAGTYGIIPYTLYWPAAVSMPTGVTFTSISVGSTHSCGLTSTGAAYCWGDNTVGQLGDGTTTKRTIPVAVNMPTGVTFASVNTGAFHTCGVTRIGKAYCWGKNSVGQLGDGNTTDRTTPVAVNMPTDVTFASISAGGQHTCGLTSAGATYCWGRNDYGQLGDGTTTMKRAIPVAVNMPTGVTFASVSTGHTHTCGVTSIGKAYCWGRNNVGQLGDGSTANRTTPVAVSTP